MSISEFVVSNYIFVLINVILILIIIFLFILISIFKDNRKSQKSKITKSYDIDISGKKIYTGDKEKEIEIDVKIDIKAIDKEIDNSTVIESNEVLKERLSSENKINVEYTDKKEEGFKEKIITKEIKKKTKEDLKIELEQNILEVGKILEKNYLSDNEVIRLLNLKEEGLDNLSDYDIKKIKLLDTVMIDNNISVDNFKIIIKEKKLKEEKEIKARDEEMKNVGLSLKNNNFSNSEVTRLLKLKNNGTGNISKDDLKRLDILEKIMDANDLPVEKIIKLVEEKEVNDQIKNKVIKNISKSLSNCNLSSDDIVRLIKLKEQGVENLSEKDKNLLKDLDVIIKENNISVEYFTEIFNEKINIDKNISIKIDNITSSLEGNNLSNDEIVRLLTLKETGDENLTTEDKNKLEILNKIILDNKMSVGGFGEMIELKIKKDEWICKKSSNVSNFIENNVMSIEQINRLLNLKTSGYTKFTQDELKKLSEIEEFFDMNFLTQDGLNEILQKNKSIESSIIKNLDDEIYKFLEKIGVSGVDLLRLFQLREQKNINLHPKDKVKIEEIDHFVGNNSIDIESLKNIINTKYSKYLNDSNINFNNLVKNNVIQNEKIDDFKTVDYKTRKYKTF